MDPEKVFIGPVKDLKYKSDEELREVRVLNLEAARVRGDLFALHISGRRLW